jgi:uncharacterized protein YbjT (DUF2867 family)
MSSELLVSGATGMIGRLLARDLAATGVPFRAMVRPGKTPADLAGTPGVTLVEGDFDDPDSLRTALEGVDRAFLLTNSSERTEQQQKNFVAAAQQAGVGAVVMLSQYAAAPDVPVRFLRYHAAIEEELRRSSMGWTFLRPNLVMQAYLPFAPLLAQGTLAGPISPDAPVSLVDARDIAAVAAAAMTQDGHDGRIYSLTGPVAITHVQIAEAFGRATGLPIAFHQVPAPDFQATLESMGMPEWQAAGLVEDYEHYDRREAIEVTPDVQQVTGSAPRDIDTFARDHAAGLRGE